MTEIIDMTAPVREGKDPNDVRDDPDFIKAVDEQAKPESILDQLISLSATNRIEVMEENLKNDYYIINDMALAGQITLFYSKYNTGKTLFFLWFLIDSIESGRIKAKNIFYINADDNYKGLYTKAMIAKEYGFHMISPQEANVSPNDVLNMLTALALTEGVHDKIIIMDTLKKFTDMMNKRAQAALYEVLRGLVTKGATVIIAGHTNKHLDADGNLVYEGTGDTMNDIDCSYAMYRLTDDDDETQIVEFRRDKDRGDVIAKVSYQYTKRKGMDYMDILSSVRKLDDIESRIVAEKKKEHALKAQYESEILFVKSLIQKGPKNQTEIINAQKTNENDLAEEITGRSLKTALDQLTGITWNMKRDINTNAKIFSIK